MKYADYFRDPKWQKLRLQVMERDGFACQGCGDTESTLNVHHSYYEKGKKPWEYPMESLVTWCEHCHEGRHKRNKDLHALIDHYTDGDFCMFEWVLQHGGIDSIVKIYEDGI